MLVGASLKAVYLHITGVDGNPKQRTYLWSASWLDNFFTKYERLNVKHIERGFQNGGPRQVVGLVPFQHTTICCKAQYQVFDHEVNISCGGTCFFHKFSMATEILPVNFCNLLIVNTTQNCYAMYHMICCQPKQWCRSRGFKRNTPTKLWFVKNQSNFSLTSGQIPGKF